MSNSHSPITTINAQERDNKDSLSIYRNHFHIPLGKNGQPSIYFCGNSLGCQPKEARADVEKIMLTWEKKGVEGHFEGSQPWIAYHDQLDEMMARIVGAKKLETTLMNTLTVNLHLMLVSFYRPTSTRYKILIEADTFPSDIYALVSHMQARGVDPEKGLVKIHPRPGKVLLREEDIVEKVEQEGDQLALILMGGLNYYSGQFMNLALISEVGHKVGAMVGFDLAHAVGNVPLSLHDWEVDFAVWCTYKYLNSGPGGISGVFIHEKHAKNSEIHRFAGWWGHNREERFQMDTEFQPIRGAEGWQLSNIPILLLASLRSSLALFDEIGMDKLRQKSVDLTQYLFDLLHPIPGVNIISPALSDHRGCQLSIKVPYHGKELFHYLIDHGVICDWREPDVIRLAPVPLYNTFEEVYQLASLFDLFLTNK